MKRQTPTPAACTETHFRSVVQSVLAASAQRADISPLVSAFVGDLGFAYGSYQGSSKLTPAGFGHVFDSFPVVWRSRYKAQNYQRSCHVARELAQSHLPIWWSNRRDVAQVDATARIKCMDGRDHGVADGISIPVHVPGGSYAYFNVGTASEIDPVEPWSPLYLQLITFASHIHASGLALLNGQDLAPDGVRLTDHERICLHWTFHGKTVWEIGIIIGRSPNTVIYHLRKAMTKLQAANKAHAAILAMQKGLI